MHYSANKSALAAVLFLLPSSLAGVIDRRMNLDETVLLTYCRDSNNNVVNAQMGYFSGTPNGMPSATTVLPANTVWEANTANVGTFAGDGNTFSSLIRFQPDDGVYAGIGHGRQGYFSCYRHDHTTSYFYTDSNGLDCIEEYRCNHNSPTSVPVYTNFSPSTGTATLENTNYMSAGSILAMAQNTFNNGICTPGNSQGIDDKGCTITFTCNANSNAELQAMQNFLVNDVAPQSSFASYSEVDNPRNPPCQSPIACPTNPPPRQYYTTMPLELSMNIDYLETPFFPEGAAAASLAYSISCPAQGCFACYLLEEFLAGASLVPDLGALAAVANVGATAGCQQTKGC